MICISIVLCYCCLFNFLTNLQDLLVKFYGIDENTANHYISIPYLMAAILTPFLGLAVDYMGKRSLLIVISSSLLIFSQFWFLKF